MSDSCNLELRRSVCALPGQKPHKQIFWQDSIIFTLCRLTSMEEVHHAHLNESQTLVNDIAGTEQSIIDCENSIESLEDRYRFFQEMRGYVRDLVECLNEKVGHYFMSGATVSVHHLIVMGGHILIQTMRFLEKIFLEIFEGTFVLKRFLR